MRKVITKEEMAALNEGSEMFNETDCVPGIDGEQVPAERMVPDAKEYISEAIDDAEAITTRRFGIHLDLRWCFFGWRKNGSKDATGSRIAARTILSSI